MQNPDYYDVNSSLLKERFPGILEFLKTAKPEAADDMEVIFAHDGFPTLRRIFPDGRVINLHSTRDPWKEAEDFIKKSGLQREGYNLVFGFGLGYHVEASIEHLGEGGDIRVVILNPEVFQNALRIRDLRRILSFDRIEFIFGETPELISKLQGLYFPDDSPPAVIIHKPSIHFDGERLAMWRDVFDNLDSERLFLSRYPSIMADNIISNLPYVVRDPGVSTLFNRFDKVPAVIVASGPSLDKNITDLKGIRGNALMVVMGSAQKALLFRGIRPDIVVSIDPFSGTYISHKGIEWDVPLLYLPIVEPRAIAGHRGKRMVGISCHLNIFSRSPFLNDKGYLESGGTVTMAALDAVIKFGCDPIIFTGLDLAPQEGRLHTDDYPLDESLERPERLVFHRMVRDIHGEKVWTYRNFYRYLQEIERRMAQERERTFIDATEGDVRKQGTLIMTLKEAAGRYCHTPVPEIKNILESVGDGLDEVTFQAVYPSIKKAVEEEVQDSKFKAQGSNEP